MINRDLPDPGPPPVAWVPRTYLDRVLAERAVRVAELRAEAARVRLLLAQEPGRLVALSPEAIEAQADAEEVAHIKAGKCDGLPGRRCGRLMHPSMLRDVSGVDPLIVGTSRKVCDACEEALYRAGRVDRIAFARQRGAPEPWLAWFAQRIERHEDLDGHPADMKARIAARQQQREAQATARAAADELAALDQLIDRMDQRRRTRGG